MLSNKGSSMYNEVQSFWSVEGLAELAGGPTICADVARGVCLLAWNFSVTRSTVLTDAERKARPTLH